MPKELKVPKAVANQRYEYYVVSAVRSSASGGGASASGGSGDGGIAAAARQWRMCALVYREKTSPLSIYAYCVDKEPAFFHNMHDIEFTLQRELTDCRRYLCSSFAFRWIHEKIFSLDRVAEGPIRKGSARPAAAPVVAAGAAAGAAADVPAAEEVPVFRTEAGTAAGPAVIAAAGPAVFDAAATKRRAVAAVAVVPPLVPGPAIVKLAEDTRLVLRCVREQGFLQADCWTVDALRRCCWDLYRDLELLPKPRCPVYLWHWSTIVDFCARDLAVMRSCPKLRRMLEKSQSQDALGWMHTDPQAVHLMQGLVKQAATLLVGTRDEYLLEECPVAEGAVRLPRPLIRGPAMVRDYAWRDADPFQFDVSFWTSYYASRSLREIIKRMARAVFGKPCAKLCGEAGATSQMLLLNWQQFAGPSFYEQWLEKKN